MEATKKRSEVLAAIEKELFEAVNAYKRCVELARADLDQVLAQRLALDQAGVESTFYRVRSLRQGAALNEDGTALCMVPVKGTKGCALAFAHKGDHQGVAAGEVVRAVHPAAEMEVPQ